MGFGAKGALAGMSAELGLTAPDAMTTQICGHLTATFLTRSKPLRMQAFGRR
jgi:hypothetical protein